MGPERRLARHNSELTILQTGYRLHSRRLMDLNKWLGIATFVLALLGGLWKVSAAWTAMNDRVTTLEQRDHYEHGNYVLPEGAK